MNWFTMLSSCSTPSCPPPPPTPAPSLLPWWKKEEEKNPEEYDSKILDRNCWWLTNTASADDDDWNALDSCSWARCACLAQIESKDSQGLWSCLWGVPDVPAQGNVKSGLFAEVMPSLYVSNSSIKQRRTFQKLFFFFPLCPRCFSLHNWAIEVC